MKFQDYYISDELKRSLKELEFRRPTDIQYKSIPAILRGEDVLAIAQTGTGKTAAFAIPVLHKIQKNKDTDRRKGIRCLVMVPTRELAIQISEAFTQIGKYTGLKTMALYGGVEQEKQISDLEGGVDVLIATPGRMFDLVSQGYVRLESVHTLVLDEADHMLDLGFVKDIQDVKKKLPRFHQTLFFSATINAKIKEVAFSLVNKAIRIQVSPKDPISKNIAHTLVNIEMDDKRFFLERILKENPDQKFIAFVRTQIRADRVVKAMERVGLKSLSIHGGKDQKDRLEVLEAFRSGEVNLLIATDVSARGIDIKGVDGVINYDLPDQPENYVHRVGRTGRGTAKGKAISFCSTEEKGILDDVEGFLGQKIDISEIDPSAYQETIDFSGDQSTSLKEMLSEIQDLEGRYKKKKKTSKTKKKK